MDSFIYIDKSSLSTELCKDIIILFEESDHSNGVVTNGYLPDVKCTRDIDIIHCDEKWETIRCFLISELTKHLKKYKIQMSTDISINISEVFPSIDKCFINALNIQKYEKNIGKFVTHIDDLVDYKNHARRIIVYMWYLNDVLEGGETVFNGKCKVKPEAGKIVMFPSTWTYPHSALIPVSGDKYIITGWFWG